MNSEKSTASKIRTAALLTGLTVLGSVSCQGPYFGYPGPPGGNVFMSPPPPTALPPDGPRPRYGHNGTESPNRPTGPKIRRDPGDTVVNVDPPEDKRDRNDNNDNNDDGPPKVESDPTPPAPPSPPPSAALKKDDLPYGQKVIGKTGVVYSPYAPDKGWVDVEGLRPGTKVKCPYTGKAFRVP